MDPNSNVTQPADRGAWQFSLRQCLVAVACMAGVCWTYRIDPFFGWLACISMTVPALLAAPVRSLGPVLLIGACVGVLAAAIGIAITLPRAVWNIDLFGLPLMGSAAVGATLGAATSLFKNGRNNDGVIFVVLVSVEILAVIYLLLPVVH